MMVSTKVLRRQQKYIETLEATKTQMKNCQSRLRVVLSQLFKIVFDKLILKYRSQ